MLKRPVQIDELQVWVVVAHGGKLLLRENRAAAVAYLQESRGIRRWLGRRAFRVPEHIVYQDAPPVLPRQQCEGVGEDRAVGPGHARLDLIARPTDARQHVQREVSPRARSGYLDSVARLGVEGEGVRADVAALGPPLWRVFRIVGEDGALERLHDDPATLAILDDGRLESIGHGEADVVEPAAG